VKETDRFLVGNAVRAFINGGTFSIKKKKERVSERKWLAWLASYT
jgi:hypothetical protein